MQVRCVTTLEELRPYVGEWDRLAGGLPFRSWTWLSHWWRHYGPSKDAEAARTRLATLCVFDDNGALSGVAPWYLDCSAMRGRVLRPLGSGEVCSDYLGILCAPSRQEAVLESLADYLVKAAVDKDANAVRWDLLDLDGIDAEDGVMSAFAARLAERGCSVHRRAGVNCWRMELPSDWEGFVASLGKNLRREVRRLERHLFETNRAVLHEVKQLDELPRVMEILIELHQARHKMLGDAGCFASARFLAFYRSVVPELLRQGCLEFFWLELDGKPVAAEYQMVGDDVMYAYQSGVDPAALEHSPGKVIHLGILRHAIAGGYRAFDFLRGDEAYKAHFGARPRASVELRIAPHRPLAQFRHNLWLAGSSLKEWVKRGIRGQGSGVRGEGRGARD
jgi:CelD/BcsL family acetyltransferase involved in cellulose biosynthesis